MKVKRKFILFFLSLFITIFFVNTKFEANAQKYDKSKVSEAIEYNDYLIDEEIKVIDKINELDNAIAKYEPIGIEISIREAKEQIQKSILFAKSANAFYGDKSLKKSIIKLLDFFDKQIDKEYSEILKYYKLPDSEYTSKEEDAVNKLLDKINEDYEVAFKKFTDAQEAFAKKFEYTLTEE